MAWRMVYGFSSTSPIASAKRSIDLRKGQKQMLAGEQRMLAPARFVNCAVDDPSDRVAVLPTGMSGRRRMTCVLSLAPPERRQPTDLKCPSPGSPRAAFNVRPAQIPMHTYESLATAAPVSSRGAPLIAELSSGLDCLTWSVNWDPSN
jgi:hypothetical protein